MLLKSRQNDLGTPAPDFDLATPEGKRFTRDDIMGKGGMLIAFICNHCPYVVSLIDRLAVDMKKLEAAGIGTAAIMSNDYAAYPSDAPARMSAFAEAHGLAAPYLVDETQEVAHAYGAVCTPDFFGYDARGKLRYRGRLDDIGMGGDPAERVPELRRAMEMVAQGGEAPADQTPSMGCSIKWR